MRFLSPRDSQITSKPVAGDATELKEELDEDRVRCVVFVSCQSVVEPSWDDPGSSIWACLPLFWFRSRTLIVTG